MRKISTLLMVALFGQLLHAQNDLAITLNSPTQGSTMGPGIPLDFEVTITNTGTADVTTNDTILYAPLLEGNLLTSGGVPVIYIVVGPLNAGQSTTELTSFPGGLNLTNAPAGTYEWCGLVDAVGPNWRGIAESDTTNNLDCADITYDPAGAVSIEENLLEARIKPINSSYYHDGQLHIRVANIPAGESVQHSVYDLNGRLVLQGDASSSNYSVDADLPMNLPAGLYILHLEHNGEAVGHSKLLVQ